MDAFDCPQYLTIWLQWASRLGKTFFGQCATLKTAASNPCPMMFASSDRKLAVEVTGRTYRMIELCPPLRDQLRPPSRRKQDLVSLWFCRMYVAWSRSVSTLADKAVCVGHANEVAKWEHPSTSREADPLKLWDDRFKEFPNHKKIKEGTPQLKHSCRVERGRLASTNCQYQVPCPHCKRYQALKLGDGKTPGGIAFDKLENGKTDKELARQTARYICLHCKGEIRNEHRGPMMRAGVWVPEGCTVNDQAARQAAEDSLTRKEFWGGWKDCPWIIGPPIRDGRDAGYQLSSLYALSLGWGDIAAEFVDCKSNAQNLRNFVNQWLGETWEILQRKASWETVGNRLIDKAVSRWKLPLWSSIVTIGVDRQEDNRYPWIVPAWGPGRRLAAIAYGQADSLDQIAREVLRLWPHEDNGAGVFPCWTLCDSGFRPDGIYEFSRQCVAKRWNVYPSKGSNRPLESDWIEARLPQNHSFAGQVLYHVDTVRSQLWAERVINDLDPRSEGGLTLYHDSSGNHEDLLKQLINDAPTIELDKHNNPREVWDRINDSIPNDYRDALRYAYVAMLIATRGGPIHPRSYTPPRVEQSEPSRFRELKIRR